MDVGSPTGGECPLCGGTGFRIVSREDGRTAAGPCECRREERRRLRLAAAQIPPRYNHCELDSGFEHHHPSQAHAFRLAQVLVEEFASVPAERRRGLLLWGGCGVGKTHLAVGVLKQLVENFPVSGLFTEFTDLLRRLQDTYDRRSETPSAAVLGPVIDADVVVLDDLGCTRMTPWIQDTLGLVVNERYNANRLTLVTTNRPLRPGSDQESLGERVTPRVYSRLLEMCRVVEIVAPDYRDIRAASNDFRRI